MKSMYDDATRSLATITKQNLSTIIDNYTYIYTYILHTMHKKHLHK